MKESNTVLEDRRFTKCAEKEKRGDLQGQL